MAVALFDFVLTTRRSPEVEPISSEDKETLLRTPKIQDTKPKQAGSLARFEAEIVSDELTLEDISTGYSELIGRMNETLDEITNRSTRLDMSFDGERQVNLAQALSSLFKGAQNLITFKMYRAALELDRELAITLGEAEYGLA